MLTQRGESGASIVDAANAHWSFTVAEISQAERPGNLLALGHLIGAPDQKYAPCELRRPNTPIRTLPARVNVLHPPTGHTGEALLHIHDMQASPCHD
jgi:hypothetical protein